MAQRKKKKRSGAAQRRDPESTPLYSPPEARRPVGEQAGHRRWEPRYFTRRFDLWLEEIKPNELNLFAVTEVLWDLSPAIFDVMPQPDGNGIYVSVQMKVV